jgi:beta-lactamase superfamily II metal-dependent hydrolase
MRRHFFGLIVALVVATPLAFHAAFHPSGLLEIHYINVGQGGSTLIIGPDGTRILYDFGNQGRGKAIAEYLRDVIGLQPRDGIHFTIVSHRDIDHYGGYIDVINAGYDITVANFDSGSDRTPTAKMQRLWLDPASTTTAGAILRIPVGLRIPLGAGAEARVVAANGRIYGKAKGDLPFARDENDRSIALYVKYDKFDYLIDGDLGAGPEPADCTDRQTTQRNFQGPVAQALIDLGWMNPERGVDVLHIAHHGSESSTSSVYFDKMRPEVALISVGLNQRTFRHPRKDVVSKVLLGPTRPSCVTAPSVLALFQTENGVEGKSATGETSFLGLPIGDIKLTTDGTSNYRISGTGRVRDGVACPNPPGGEWIFSFDEAPGTPPAHVNSKCQVSPTACVCET